MPGTKLAAPKTGFEMIRGCSHLGRVKRQVVGCQLLRRPGFFHKVAALGRTHSVKESVSLG